MSSFHIEQKSSALILQDDLPGAVEELARAIRKAIRRPQNLLKGEHEYWIPERLPSWQTCWDMESCDTVKFVKARHWELASLKALQELLIPFRRDLWFTGIYHRDATLEVTVLFTGDELSIVHEPQTNASVDSAAFWEQMGSAAGIPELFKRQDSHTFTWSQAKRDGYPSVSFGKYLSTDGDELELSDFPSDEEAHNCFYRIAAVLDEFQKPDRLAVTMQPSVDEVPKLVEECSRQNSHWALEFFGKYRRKFDPYATPKNPDGRGFYPVLQSTPDGEFIEVQVSVEHAKGKSWLVLHSEAGENLLRTVIEEAGLEATYDSGS